MQLALVLSLITVLSTVVGAPIVAKNEASPAHLSDRVFIRSAKVLNMIINYNDDLSEPESADLNPEPQSQATKF
ncbi:hypothetical protein sscle_10g080580 [Sclerotinia sclerotiorum 1980 UF-70]|uniref:Uncharacterized protein n=1 Tax=Sclerotinia sclerotiorum (strain ATCC 18683 / 1980 / Ss-1) TaxID=665079 RepID=A0A1D9QEH4_SCLS1|nr:hypothetical protein sscle_10g080580 [Sclerotinia sclerotiorum 1980 UF-70]